MGRCPKPRPLFGKSGIKNYKLNKKRRSSPIFAENFCFVIKKHNILRGKFFILLFLKK